MNPASHKRLLEPYHLALILLLLVSGAIRLHGIKTCYPYMIYVDEGHVVRHALNMYREQTLDPRWYWHNTLLMTTIDLVVWCIAELDGDPEAFRQSVKYYPLGGFKDKPQHDTEPFYELVEPPIFLVVGRAIVAICGTLTIAVAFFLFREFLPPWPALMSAALLSALPTLVMNSHYLIGDIPMLLMYTGVALCAVRWFRTRRATWLWSSAVLCGAAASFKMTGVISLGLPLLLLAGSKVPLSRRLLGLALLPLVTWLSFHLFCPGLWMKEGEIAESMRYMAGFYTTKGGSHGDHVRQLMDPDLYGVPLILLAGGGLILGLVVTKRRRLLGLLALYVLLFLGFYSTNTFQPPRSLFPIVPLLVLFVGCGVWKMSALATARRRGPASAVAATVLLVLTCVCGADAWAKQRDFVQMTETRIALADWLGRNLAPGARVAVLDLVGLHPSVIRSLPASIEVLSLDQQEQLLSADWIVLPSLAATSPKRRANQERDVEQMEALLDRLHAADRPVAFEIGHVEAPTLKNKRRPRDTRITVFGPLKAPSSPALR